MRIVQITDTHLYADPLGKLMGLVTRNSLRKVIDIACENTQPELVVASGDLAHDGSPEAYKMVREQFSRIHAPVFCIPGNHDEATALQEYLNHDGFHNTHSTLINDWQMVFLNSTIPGSENGHLDQSELETLDATLARYADQHAIIWLHHPPIKVGSSWLDTMAIDNPDEFFAVIDHHPQVRAIIWGHIHQSFDTMRSDIRLLGTPSTCIQFMPGSAGFGLEKIPPGYRWMDLYPDGSIETGIERVAEIPGELDLVTRCY